MYVSKGRIFLFREKLKERMMGKYLNIRDVNLLINILRRSYVKRKGLKNLKFLMDGYTNFCDWLYIRRVYIDRLDCTFCVYHMRMHTVRGRDNLVYLDGVYRNASVRGKETRCTVSTYRVHLYPSDISTLEAFLRTVQTTTTTSISIGTTLSVSVVPSSVVLSTIRRRYGWFPRIPGIVPFSFGNNGAHRKKREEALDLIFCGTTTHRSGYHERRISIRTRYELVFFFFFFLLLVRNSLKGLTQDYSWNDFAKILI